MTQTRGRKLNLPAMRTARSKRKRLREGRFAQGRLRAMATRTHPMRASTHTPASTHGRKSASACVERSRAEIHRVDRADAAVHGTPGQPELPRSWEGRTQPKRKACALISFLAVRSERSIALRHPLLPGKGAIGSRSTGIRAGRLDSRRLHTPLPQPPQTLMAERGAAHG